MFIEYQMPGIEPRQMETPPLSHASKLEEEGGKHVMWPALWLWKLLHASDTSIPIHFICCSNWCGPAQVLQARQVYFSQKRKPSIGQIDSNTAFQNWYFPAIPARWEPYFSSSRTWTRWYITIKSFQPNSAKQRLLDKRPPNCQKDSSL